MEVGDSVVDDPSAPLDKYILKYSHEHNPFQFMMLFVFHKVDFLSLSLFAKNLYVLFQASEC